jgi:hypothetical protein
VTAFSDVVSATPWRTELLIATVDGVRMWALSDGDVEMVVPDHFSVEDIRGFQTWLTDDDAARRAGVSRPNYLGYTNPSLPRVPITADEMAFLVGFPPDGVNLQQMLDDAQDGAE